MNKTWNKLLGKLHKQRLKYTSTIILIVAGAFNRASSSYWLAIVTAAWYCSAILNCRVHYVHARLKSNDEAMMMIMTVDNSASTSTYMHMYTSKHLCEYNRCQQQRDIEMIWCSYRTCNIVHEKLPALGRDCDGNFTLSLASSRISRSSIYSNSRGEYLHVNLTYIFIA